MKAILLAILALSCVFITSCSKKSTSTMVSTKVAYSHANQASGGVAIIRRQALGTITQETPSSGQRIALKSQKEVWFSQSTDATDQGKIKVTLKSKLDGFDSETQVFNFDEGMPNPPAATFKNGLKAFVSVNTYIE